MRNSKEYLLNFIKKFFCINIKYCKNYTTEIMSLKNLVVFRYFNPLNLDLIKRSNTLKQFAGISQRIVWACLTILWGWRLKG